MRHRQVKEATVGFPKREWSSGDLIPGPPPALLCDSHYNGGDESIEDTQTVPSFSLTNCCKEFMLCLTTSLFAFASLLDSEGLFSYFQGPLVSRIQTCSTVSREEVCGTLPTPCLFYTSSPRLFLGVQGLSSLTMSIFDAGDLGGQLRQKDELTKTF